jgi:hypothetical protein
MARAIELLGSITRGPLNDADEVEFEQGVL